MQKKNVRKNMKETERQILKCRTMRLGNSFVS